MADLTVSFELYNEETVRILKEEDPDLLPDYSVNSSKDLAYNKKQVTSAVTSGIIKGESIPKIASNLQSTIKNLNQSSAVSAARTAAIAAQNTGSLSSMKRLAEMGVEVQKEWVATLDSRTRLSHRALDGQRRDLDEAFSNGLQYPGASGNPAERWNCRCKIKAYMPKYDSEDEPRLTYSEWYKTKLPKNSSGTKITAKQQTVKEIGGVKCYVETKKYDFPDGWNGIMKTVDATIYTTPDGTQFIYPKNYDHMVQTLDPEDAIRVWYTIPEKARSRFQKTIEIVDYKNKADSYWEKIYKNFTESYATGGDTITIYKSNYHDLDYLKEVYCHEGGHYIDYTLPNCDKTNKYCKQSEWQAAIASDLNTSFQLSITEYGENSPEEDFAESVAYYITKHATFVYTMPERAKLLDKIFK